MKYGFAYNRIIFDPSGVPIDFIILDSNTAFLQILNLSKESLGKKATQLFPDMHKTTPLIKSLQQLVEGNQARLELFIDFNDKLYSLFAYTPEPGHFALITEDITEQKRTEVALHEKEERFRVMANGSPNILWITNKNGETSFVNKKYSEFFGITVEQANGGKWKPFVHPQDAKEHISEYFLALEQKRAFFGQARVRRADGNWRWIESHGEPYFSPDNEFLGHIGVTVDITERKNAQEALEISENRFKQFAESAEEWIWEIDLRGMYSILVKLSKKFSVIQLKLLLVKSIFLTFLIPLRWMT